MTKYSIIMSNGVHRDQKNIKIKITVSEGKWIQDIKMGSISNVVLKENE